MVQQSPRLNARSPKRQSFLPYAWEAGLAWSSGQAISQMPGRSFITRRETVVAVVVCLCFPALPEKDDRNGCQGEGGEDGNWSVPFSFAILLLLPDSYEIYINKASFPPKAVPFGC